MFLFLDNLVWQLTRPSVTTYSPMGQIVTSAHSLFNSLQLRNEIRYEDCMNTTYVPKTSFFHLVWDLYHFDVWCSVNVGQCEKCDNIPCSSLRLEGGVLMRGRADEMSKIAEAYKAAEIASRTFSCDYQIIKLMKRS